MIPLSPETFSATHIEYLPLPATYLTSAVFHAYACHCNRMCGLDGGGPAVVENADRGEWNDNGAEPLAKLRKLADIQCSAVTLSQNATLNYFRGGDLRYAPHVNVPAAKSVEDP